MYYSLQFPTTHHSPLTTHSPATTHRTHRSPHTPYSPCAHPPDLRLISHHQRSPLPPPTSYLPPLPSLNPPHSHVQGAASDRFLACTARRMVESGYNVYEQGTMTELLHGPTMRSVQAMVLGPRWWCGGEDNSAVWGSHCPFAHARVAMRSVRKICGSYGRQQEVDILRHWPPPPLPPPPSPKPRPPPPPAPPRLPAANVVAERAAAFYASKHNCAIRVKDAFSRLVRQACIRLADSQTNTTVHT